MLEVCLKRPVNGYWHLQAALYVCLIQSASSQCNQHTELPSHECGIADAVAGEMAGQGFEKIGEFVKAHVFAI